MRTLYETCPICHGIRYSQPGVLCKNCRLGFVKANTIEDKLYNLRVCSELFIQTYQTRWTVQAVYQGLSITKSGDNLLDLLGEIEEEIWK